MVEVDDWRDRQVLQVLPDLRDEQATRQKASRVVEDDAGANATLAVYRDRLRGSTP